MSQQGVRKGISSGAEMEDEADIEWQKCGVDGCIGVRPEGTNGCLAEAP